MGFHTWSVWLCFVNFVYGNAINTTLNKISSIRVPHSYGSVAYELDSYDAKAVAYDTDEKIMYCVGK